jgi:hypothetical protein
MITADDVIGGLDKQLAILYLQRNTLCHVASRVPLVDLGCLITDRFHDL